MQTVNHPLAPEELMAYLDGELPAGQAVGAAAHLEKCAECRELADGLRGVSQALPAWEVEAAGERVAQSVMEALRVPVPAVAKAPRKWFGVPRWAWGLASAGAVVVVLGLGMRPSLNTRRQSGAMSPQATAADYGTRLKAVFTKESQRPSGVVYDTETNVALAPMIARTAQLQLTTRDFDHIRARLDDILKRHSGYIGELNVANPTDAGRTLSGKLQVPASQLDAAMSEIKPLGRVDSESQSGEEVTASYTDLEARLANSRRTEQRIVDLLRERTGKLSDVLDAERELGRVRGEIEQMEAQRTGLLKRVDFATLTLTVNEEYQAQIHAAGGLSTQFRNAAVDGFRGMAGSVVGVALFLLSSGPVLLLWAAILFFPARFAWRRWQDRRAAR
jgi:anti-sigma factor RsiW